MQHVQVIIVTNAMEPWVETSCRSPVEYSYPKLSRPQGSMFQLNFLSDTGLMPAAVSISQRSCWVFPPLFSDKLPFLVLHHNVKKVVSKRGYKPSSCAPGRSLWFAIQLSPHQAHSPCFPSSSINRINFDMHIFQNKVPFTRQQLQRIEPCTAHARRCNAAETRVGGLPPSSPCTYIRAFGNAC